MSSDSAERRVANATEARELLRAWAASGEPMSTWCTKRGINWYSLSAYKGWPGRRRERFVEIETTALVRTPSGARGVYRVVVGDRAIEIGPDFDGDVLRRIVQVIESC